MDKKQRKALLRRGTIVGRDEIVAGMPISPDHLHQLLNHLDANLTSCDHTTKLTTTFLHAQNLDAAKILPWLADHVGYCDCEMLANLTDLDDSLQSPPQSERVTPPPKEKRAARNLDSLTGWNFKNLPAPWRIANLHAPAEPLKLTLGKKDGCSIQIIESPLPAGDQAADEFWTRLWYDRTKLPPRGPLQVNRAVLALPPGLQSTLVRAPSWTPVYCWIVPDSPSWHLEVRTESNRYTGDVSQISTLISLLTSKTNG